MALQDAIQFIREESAGRHKEKIFNEFHEADGLMAGCVAWMDVKAFAMKEYPYSARSPIISSWIKPLKYKLVALIILADAAEKYRSKRLEPIYRDSYARHSGEDLHTIYVRVLEDMKESGSISTERMQRLLDATGGPRFFGTHGSSGGSSSGCGSMVVRDIENAAELAATSIFRGFSDNLALPDIHTYIE